MNVDEIWDLGMKNNQIWYGLLELRIEDRKDREEKNTERVQEENREKTLGRVNRVSLGRTGMGLWGQREISGPLGFFSLFLTSV